MSSELVRELCTNCERETQFERNIKEEKIKIRGEPIEVEIEYSKCKNCGDEVLDPSSNLEQLDAAYREYRKKYGLLQPEEIRDLSQQLCR